MSYIKDAMKRHPYISLAMLCALCTVFEQWFRTYEGSNRYGFPGEVSGVIYLGVLFLELLAVLAFWSNTGKKDTPILYRIIYTVALASALFLADRVYLAAEYRAKGLIILVALICAVLAIYWYQDKKLSIPKAILLIGILGFALRLGYILFTEVSTRQHDVHSFFTSTNGHSSYIQYIYDNWSLPKGDPRETFQYYHPPLHHIICAVWLKVQTSLGIAYDVAKENLQLLTLFYSSAIMIVSYRIFEEFKLKGAGLILGFSIIALHPTFFFLAGSVNNDILSILFIFIAILYAIRWNKEPSYKNIICTALGIGLSMMTKLSGALVAVPVAVIFLGKIFDRNYGFKRLWKQFLAFGAICVPLGLWWPLRCYFLYDMPITYVPKLSVTNRLYVGDYSAIQRFFSLKGFDFLNTYPARGEYGYGEGFYEYNIGVTLTKTSIFGEYFLGRGSAFCELLANVMYYSSIVIIALSIAGMAKVLRDLIRRRFKKPISFDGIKGEGGSLYIFIFIYYAVLMASFVNFCFQYPHNCTMDFRYIVPTLLTGGLFLGIFANQCQESKSGSVKAFYYISIAVTAIFCISSAAFFALVRY